MRERTSAAPERRRRLEVARLGAIAAGLAVSIGVAGLATGSAAPPAAVLAAQEATPAPAPPPPDDIAATVSGCLDAGVDFSDCVDATVAELLPLLEAAVPAEGGSTGEAPPPPPVFVLPPLPLPLPPVLGGGAEDVATDEDAADDEAAEDEDEDEETGA